MEIVKNGDSKTKRAKLEKDILGQLFWGKFRDEQRNDKGQYTFEVHNMSDAALSMMENADIQYNKHDEKGNYITLKSMNPFEFEFANGQELEENQLLGNGTEIRITLGWYENRYGKFPTLFGPIRVIKTVPFTRDDSSRAAV